TGSERRERHRRRAPPRGAHRARAARPGRARTRGPRRGRPADGRPPRRRAGGLRRPLVGRRVGAACGPARARARRPARADLARVLSVSFVGTLPRGARAEVEERVRALARAAEQPIRLTYMTELYVGFAS